MNASLFISVVLFTYTCVSVLNAERNCRDCYDGSTQVRNGKPVGETCKVIYNNMLCLSSCGSFKLEKFKNFYAKELDACGFIFD